MKISSLRFRVTAWYVGLLAGALLLFGFSVYIGLRQYLRSSLERSLSAEARAIGHNFVEFANSKGADWIANEVAESYAPETVGGFIRITRVDRDQSVIYRSGAAKNSTLDGSSIQPLPQMPEAAFYRNQSIGRQSGDRLEIYSLPFTSEDGGRFLIEVGASTSPLDRILRSLLLTLLLPIPVILVVAAVGGYLLMSRPLRPVVALTEQAELIGAEGRSGRLPIIATGDELEKLSLSLNRMLARLEDALNHIHRFTADVSHELRTPLTILRGELEHVVQRKGLDPIVADATGSALEEIERMSKIVDNLLVISRLDSGDAKIEPVVVDLQQMACATMDQLRILAEDKNLQMTCQQGAAVNVFGDAMRLKQVVVNLLDNAIKYTPEGGTVEIRTGSSGENGILQVRDSGIGIPADALPFVFERFFRADKARSRGSGGAGLGLSIVKAICSAHGGTISLSSVEGAGTTVLVELPLYQSLAGRASKVPTAHAKLLIGRQASKGVADDETFPAQVSSFEPREL
ncbi:MAG: sensor histidine kinase [Terriglobales bacterium]